MDNHYSFWADMLSKFHTSPDWIQALWLLVVPITLVGLAWCLKEAMAAFTRKPHSLPEGELAYRITRTSNGELCVYRVETLQQAAETNSILLLPATASHTPTPNP